MSPSQLATIRRHCQPLDPVPTGVTPVLHKLHGIRAVLFDVYGTLFISASGEVGTMGGGDRDHALPDALQAVGLQLRPISAGDRLAVCRAATGLFEEIIHAAHEKARRSGVDFPEVDIVAVWEETLARMRAHHMLAASSRHVDVHQLAVEYEVRVNPTWPMPGAAACLRALVERGVRTGIVSNAQFFTPALFAALLDRSPGELGMVADLLLYSYQWGWAKPGRYLYDLAARRLSAHDVPPGNVLFIGNDMLNDVLAAGSVGFRTALFAGDARSLRRRSGDPRVADVQPDLVVTELVQLVECMG